MVNTFLVDSDFQVSASQLDSRRLGKQRVEAYQILNIIENLRILSGQSGIRCKTDFHTFVNEIKKWYHSKPFVYILDQDGLIEHYDKEKPTLEPNQRQIKMGFSTHPIVEMWFGYEDALKEYIDAHIQEWTKRGFKNTMTVYHVKAKRYPPWIYWTHFHENHRGALIAKEIDRNEKPWYQYKEEFLNASKFVDYIWVKNNIVYKQTMSEAVTDIEKKMNELMIENERLKRENSSLKSTKEKDFELETPIGILQTIAEGIFTKEKDSSAWNYSPLETLNQLKNDCSGKVGELLIHSLCMKGNIEHTYHCDMNSKDGCYDMVINGKKVEIKTAKLGKQGSFQHENLRVTGYDYLLFLDVCPSYYYITIVPKFDLHEKSELFGRKAHLRKGTFDVYKLDFTEKILKTLLEKGHTINVSSSCNLKDVVSFIENSIPK